MKQTTLNQLEVLALIAQDCEQDAEQFDGKPFNGKTVGEMNGNLCAAIVSLANILKAHIRETEP